MWISPDPARQFHSLYSYTGNGYNPINSTDPDGRKVELQHHTVFIPPIDHSLLRITPENQARWRHLAGDKGFFTIGAGPEGPLSNNILVAGIDRVRDVTVSKNGSYTVPLPSGYSNEDDFISALLARTKSYNNDVSYDFFPNVSAGYNSNSFISGLLGTFGFNFGSSYMLLPGFSKPLPAQNFDNPGRLKIEIGPITRD